MTEKEPDMYQGCPYCGTMWFEVESEGSPCGIDGCTIFTCCEKSWQDHIKEYHPNYKKEENNGEK